MSYPGIFELFNFRDDSEYCQFDALCTVKLQESMLARDRCHEMGHHARE